MNKVFWKKHSATILTGIGAAGVVGTTIMAVQATPKALRLLDAAKDEKGDDLTKLEKVRGAGPAYIPTIVTGVATITCIFGANSLNKHQQATLMSAYALVDKSYKEYKAKVNELYGDDATKQVEKELAKDTYKDYDASLEGNEKLYYDMFSQRYFEATPEMVRRAEYELNRSISLQECAYLNEFYVNVGLEPIESGWSYGWARSINNERYWQEWVDFEHEKVIMDDGLECIIITFGQDPILDFENYY